MASCGCRPSPSCHLTAPLRSGPWWWSKMSTKLGIWSLATESQNSRPDTQSPQAIPSPKSLVSDFPWEATLQVRGLEDHCLIGVPR